MSREQPFEGAARRLANPSTWANVAVAAAAAVYANVTLRVSATAQQPFALLVLGAAGVSLVLARLLVARHLRTLRRLGAGAVPASRAAVIGALGEARSFPDFIAMLTLVTWALGVSLTAAAMAIWAGSPASVALRLVALAAMFAPISAILANLLVARQVRALMEEASGLLTPSELLQAFPPARRQLKARLLGVTATLVLLPSAMLVDLSRHLGDDALTQLVELRGPAFVEARAEARRSAWQATLALSSLVLALGVAIAWAAGGAIADPLRLVAQEASAVARGEMPRPRVIAADDEVWAVTSTFTLMQVQLEEVLSKLRKAGLSIGSSTHQLVATGSRYEGASAEQAAALNQTSATTEELAQSARQIAHNAQAVADIARQTLEEATRGQASAEAFARAVERMQGDNRAIYEAVSRLERRVQQIGKIVEFITAVADRSDLLALSAELEGSKAGEVGRGFTLVASEMRRLAENVLESTSEVEELIVEIREATRVTVQATETGMSQTQGGLAASTGVTASLERVVALATRTSEAVRAISLATQQQQSGTDQLAEAMADILGITQQSLAATRQLTSANSALMSLSGTLKTLVERFEVRG